MGLIAPPLLQKPERWPPESTVTKPDWVMPGWAATIGRGALGHCPHCNKGRIFDGYLKVFPACAVCGAPLGEMPADDAPPYIAMLAVLHVMAFMVVLIFRYHLSPNMFEYGALLILLIAACMVALRMAKGAVIGILLKLGMRRGALN